LASGKKDIQSFVLVKTQVLNKTT